MATLLSQPQQQQQQQQQEQQHREHGHEQREQQLKHAGRLQGCALLQQQLHALLVKRALFASRGRLTLLVHVLVPVMLVREKKIFFLALYEVHVLRNKGSCCTYFVFCRLSSMLFTRIVCKAALHGMPWLHFRVSGGRLVCLLKGLRTYFTFY